MRARVKKTYGRTLTNPHQREVESPRSLISAHRKKRSPALRVAFSEAWRMTDVLIPFGAEVLMLTREQFEAAREAGALVLGRSREISASWFKT